MGAAPGYAAMPPLLIKRGAQRHRVNLTYAAMQTVFGINTRLHKGRNTPLPPPREVTVVLEASEQGLEVPQQRFRATFCIEAGGYSAAGQVHMRGRLYSKELHAAAAGEASAVHCWVGSVLFDLKYVCTCFAPEGEGSSVLPGLACLDIP